MKTVRMCTAVVPIVFFRVGKCSRSIAYPTGTNTAYIVVSKRNVPALATQSVVRISYK